MWSIGSNVAVKLDGWASVMRRGPGMFRPIPKSGVSAIMFFCCCVASFLLMVNFKAPAICIPEARRFPETLTLTLRVKP